MDFSPQSLIPILEYLASGFLAGIIFHSLTPHKKGDHFDRLVQAFIFSLAAGVVAVTIKTVFLDLGLVFSLGEWGQGSDRLNTLLSGVVVGLIATWVSNSDGLFSLLRYIKITRRTSYPSDWYAALYRHRGWLTLHLNDERRLNGWASLWPTENTKGHFVIMQPAWLSEDNTQTVVDNCESIMIKAEDVSFIEFQ